MQENNQPAETSDDTLSEIVPVNMKWPLSLREWAQKHAKTVHHTNLTEWVKRLVTDEQIRHEEKQRTIAEQASILAGLESGGDAATLEPHTEPRTPRKRTPVARA